jgi:hypothetical protein
MEGMGHAATLKIDLAVATGWHAAIFGLSGYAGQLKGKTLSDFLSAGKRTDAAERSRNAEAIAFFHSLQARGIPVEITRH